MSLYLLEKSTDFRLDFLNLLMERPFDSVMYKNRTPKRETDHSRPTADGADELSFSAVVISPAISDQNLSKGETAITNEA